MSTIAIIISGAKGRMGQAIASCIENEENDLVFGGGVEFENHPEMGKPLAPSAFKLSNNVAKAQEQIKENFSQSVVIEFTTPQATLMHLTQCTNLKIPMVIGTTGFSEEEKKEIVQAGQKIPIVFAPNFSIGVNLVTQMVQQLASLIPNAYDLEIVEAHHSQKKDAPSGTALRLAQALADGKEVNLKDVICMHREGQTGERPAGQIGIQTIRGGDIVGDHTVIFAGPGERIEITHRAHNRSNFASGSLRASLWLWNNGKIRSPGVYDMFDVLNLKKT